MTNEPAKPSPNWIPEHLRNLTRETATDEQRAELRAAFRRHVDALKTYWTPERRAQRYAAFLTSIDARAEEIRAAREEEAVSEAADPTLKWQRFGREAAKAAKIAERYVPAEGVELFRAAFDEALRQARSQE